MDFQQFVEWGRTIAFVSFMLAVFVWMIYYSAKTLWRHTVTSYKNICNLWAMIYEALKGGGHGK